MAKEYGQLMPLVYRHYALPDTVPHFLDKGHLKAQSNAARALPGPSPRHGHREIPHPPALPPVSREGGNIFLEDSSESSGIHSFTGVRVPQGTNHICKGYGWAWGRETQVSDRMRQARGGRGGQQPLQSRHQEKDTSARSEDWGRQPWQWTCKALGRRA